MRFLLVLALLGCPGPDSDSAVDSGEADPGCQRIELAPSGLRWEGVEPGTSVQGAFTLANTCTTGVDTLEVSLQIDDPAYSFTAESWSLAPNSSTEVTVTFTALDTSSHVTAAVLSSNDPTRPEAFLALEGLVTTDADGDGFPNLGAGGDDCDDTDAAVHPGANETWYDGTDSDCDGANDFDQDGDGWPALAYGGNDCNDLDPAIAPGTPETPDGVDQDCDGMSDEDFVVAGDILITEVMAAPGGVEDASGEWFEVHNTTNSPIDLFGWVVTNSYGQSFEVNRHVEIEGQGHAVLGSNDDAVTNGGVTVDSTYDHTLFALAEADALSLAVDGRTVATASWSGFTAGRARALDPDHHSFTEAALEAWWCESATAMSGTDYGTPHAVNGQCTTVDEDADGVSEADGDCDDADASVNPSATESWDEVDNDCNGTVDDAVVSDIASARLDGAAYSYLGSPDSVAFADVTGDGADDLLLGAPMENSYSGTVWMVDAGDVVGTSGLLSSVDSADIEAGVYDFFGSLAPVAVDLTGDGTVDVAAAGSPYVTYGEGPILAVYAGGAAFTGSLDVDDAAYFVADDDGSTVFGLNRVLSHLDVDADGLNDAILGAEYGGSDGFGRSTGTVAFFDAYGASGTAELADAWATLSGNDDGDRFGSSVAGGDLTGDGYDDVVIGAMGVSESARNAGAYYVVSGHDISADADVADVARTVVYGSAISDTLGRANAAVGNFDGSGALDVAIAGLGNDTVYVFWNATSLGAEVEADDADVRILGSNTFGFTLLASDADADGRTDLVVGAPALAAAYLTSSYWPGLAGSDFGTVSIFDRDVLGTAGDHVAADAFRGLVGDDSGDLFGGSIAAGDVDADGREDLAVSAPYASRANGRVYVVLGQ